MAPWLEKRIDIIKLTLRHSRLFVLLAVLQAAALSLRFFPPDKLVFPALGGLARVPWYAWVIGWMALFWFVAIEYALKRRERFDFTSKNFFKSYLDFIINEGGRLLSLSEDPDFYPKVSEWQRQVVEGISIGQGPEASEQFFQKMDTQCSLVEAYKKSQDLRNNDPLCRALLDNIEELKAIRAALTEPEDHERLLVEADGQGGGGGYTEPRKMKLIGGSNVGSSKKSKV